MQWFTLHTYSGFESKVKQNIEHIVAVQGLKSKINQVVIPAENIIEIKDGKKRRRQRNLMPGYVLIQMEPDEELFNLIRSIGGVTGFVGDGMKPTPLSDQEVQDVFDLFEDKKEKPRPTIKYRKGQQVKIVSGPFAEFIGVIDEIEEEKCKLRVMVTIFGRPTPVELDVFQVESV